MAGSLTRLAWRGLIGVVCLPHVALAQGVPCTTTITDRSSLIGGLEMRITYDLTGPSDDVSVCVVTLRLILDGQEPPVDLTGSIGDVTVGTSKVVFATFKTPQRPNIIDPQLRAVARVPPPPVRRPWRAGVSWFTAVEPRQGTATLTTHLATGAAVSVGLPLRRRWELALEAGGPLWKQNLDNRQTGSSAEHLLLRDSFFSALVGPVAGLARRAQVVPLIGGGGARIETRRLLYTLSGRSVVGAPEETSTTTLAFTAGVDLRVALGGGVRVVASHRLHMPADTGDAAPRPRVQHRSGVGIHVDFGGR